MNLALESTREFIEDQETNSYGDVFIRGNNGKYIITRQMTSFRVLTDQYCIFQLYKMAGRLRNLFKQ